MQQKQPSKLDLIQQIGCAITMIVFFTSVLLVLGFFVFGLIYGAVTTH